jgi:hypothetical protein
MLNRSLVTSFGLCGAALLLAAGCAASPGAASRSVTAASPSPTPVVGSLAPRPDATPPTPPTSPATPPPVAPPADAPPVASRCTVANLVLLQGRSGFAAGNIYTAIFFKNRSDRTCWLYGFPGLLMLDASGQAMQTHAVWGLSFAGVSAKPTTVMLAPGVSAPFFIHYTDVTTGNETTCPVASSLLVTPPDETHQLRLPGGLAPCGHGTIDVSPVTPSGTEKAIAG